MHCDSCNFWIHKSCEGLTEDEFQRLVEEDDDIPFSCLTCKIKQNAEIFLFGLLSKFELLDLYGIDLPSLAETFPCFETQSSSTISSRYYDLNEINKIKLTRQFFSVFHTNIRSLSKHFDELHAQLNMLNIPFDIIGFSESKQQIGKDFLINIQMDGYSMYSRPSKSSCGGCVLYVNSRLDHHVRDDLSVIEDDYETIWIEINNHKSKNLLCCCLYRHPSSDITNFNNHISSILQKVQKENKSLIMMGDFNINLVNYDSHPETNDFINLMVSHYLLPHILHPARVTDHSATIINNIFFNTLEFDTLSGNLLT